MSIENRESLPLQFLPLEGSRVPSCNVLQHREQVRPIETKRKITEIVKAAFEAAPGLKASIARIPNAPSNPDAINNRALAVMEVFVDGFLKPLTTPEEAAVKTDSQPPTPPTPSEGEISIGTAVSHAVRVIGVLAQKEPQKLTSHVVTLFEGLMDPDRQLETVNQVETLYQRHLVKQGR